MQETLGGSATVCIASFGDQTSLTVAVARDGGAATSTFSDLDVSSFQFSAIFSVMIAAPIFDGDALDLAALAGSYATSISVQTAVNGIPIGQTQLVPLHDAFLSGTGTMTFRPL